MPCTQQIISRYLLNELIFKSWNIITQNLQYKLWGCFEQTEHVTTVWVTSRPHLVQFCSTIAILKLDSTKLYIPVCYCFSNTAHLILSVPFASNFPLPLIHHVICSVQFSHSIMSDSLRPRGLQHARPPCPPTPQACSSSCPSSRWCHPTISPFVVPFSSCLQSFLASGSFLRSQFFLIRWPESVQWIFHFNYCTFQL